MSNTKTAVTKFTSAIWRISSLPIPKSWLLRLGDLRLPPMSLRACLSLFWIFFAAVALVGVFSATFLQDEHRMLTIPAIILGAVAMVALLIAKRKPEWPVDRVLIALIPATTVLIIYVLYRAETPYAVLYQGTFVVGIACCLSSLWIFALSLLSLFIVWLVGFSMLSPPQVLVTGTAAIAFAGSALTILLQRASSWHKLQTLTREGEGTRQALQLAVDHAAASAATLSALVEHTDDFIWSVDRQHRLIAANRSMRNMLKNNFQIDIKLGDDMLRHFHPKLQERWRTRYRRALAGEHFVIEESYEINNAPRFFEISLAPIRSDNRISAISIIGRDVTRRKNMESALRESQERYALAAEGSHDGIWDWNLRANTLYLSKRWKEMLGYEDYAIRDHPDEWLKRIHPDDVQSVSNELSLHLNNHEPHFQSEHRIRHRDGSYRWFLCRGLAVRDQDGTAYRIAGSHSDITEQKRVQEKLLTDAFTDALTDLPNRDLFLDRLGQVMRRAERGRNPAFAVLFIDIDRFKVVNESLGHSVGDQLLVDIAKRLEECVRPGDTVARFGGDEFAVLLEDVEERTEASQVALRIKQALSGSFNLRGQEVFSSASIGITLGHGQYASAQDVLRDADSALYRAKARGKARYEFFQTGMYTNALALLTLENELRRAIERDEFVLHYQPIVDLERHASVGFEALVRWQHQDRGLIAPAAFISVAEETGIVMPLGRWVIKEACEQIIRWSKDDGLDPDMYVSVNLSARQLLDQELVPHIREVLGRCGLDPRRLRLEITESAIIDNDDVISTVLSELHDLNIMLYLDDFGTGYSSLSYLHRLPVDAIKIDRSFVMRLSPQASDPSVVPTLISLANALNIITVAEGVETAWQRGRLQELGCRYAQGYLFAEPLAAAHVADWLKRHSPGDLRA